MTINLYRHIDKLVGGTLCAVGRLLPKKNLNLENVRSILIIKLWAVGESVLTLPMIAALKKKYPTAHITILARQRNAAVYEGLSFIDEILLFEPTHLSRLMLRFKTFDLTLDCEPYLNISALLGRWLAKNVIGFDHGIRSKLYTKTAHYNDQQHVVKTYLDLGKIFNIDTTKNALIKLTYTKSDANAVNELLHSRDIVPNDMLIGFCPSVAETGKDRMWPHDYYAMVADQLVERYDAKIILVGTATDYAHNNAIISLCKHKERLFNLAGKTTLKQLFNIVEHCALFISNDTGPMHIAAAQGTTTIGLFGPNLPIRFAPLGKKNIALYAQQYCSPCINVHQGSFPACYNPIKGKCLKDISPHRVLEAAHQCLKK